MLHDEMEYPNPDQFVPERFMSEDGHVAARDPRTVLYGFGRR